jgi:hypothetical protein
VTLRARWVTLRARWLTLRARWVMLRARWVTLRARWVMLMKVAFEKCLPPDHAKVVKTRALWVATATYVDDGEGEGHDVSHAPDDDGAPHTVSLSARWRG